MKEPSWNNDDSENGKICLSNAKELFFSNIKLAVKYSELAIDYFKNDDKSLCDLAQCYYIKACGLWQTNREEANLYYVESIKKHILGSQTENYKKHRFYKFVGIKESKDIDSILNRIRLIHPSNFNDPMDCPIASDSKNGIPNINLFNGLRVACFGIVDGKDYFLDASKWSYYGDFHRGICIEYDFSQLNFNNKYSLMGKIKYEPQYIPDKGIVGSGLLTKSIDYIHENEWRIISYNEDLISKDPEYIDINSSVITKIYLGYKCSEDVKKYISIFQRINPHIKVFQIQPSEENFYKLSANELL